MPQVSNKELQEQLESVGPLIAHSNGNKKDLEKIRELEMQGSIDGVIINGVKAPQLIKENGPWRVIEKNGKVIIASDDFSHDAWLNLSGDFSDTEEKIAYAKEIAKALNDYNFSGSTK